MVDIVSAYVAKIGQLIVNLASRPNVHVSLSVAETVMTSRVLTLKVTMIKGGKSATISELITEAAIEGIPDVATVADALTDKLRKML